MICEVFIAMGVISGAYLGGKSGFNEAIQHNWDKAEIGFCRLLAELGRKKPAAVIGLIASSFGYLAVMSGIVAFIAMQISGEIPIILSNVFAFSVALWGSIRWAFGNNKLAVQFSLSFFQYSLMVFAFPVIDTMTGQDMTRLLASPLDPLTIFALGFPLSDIWSTWLLALIIAGIIFFAGLMYVVFTTAIVAPIFSAIAVLGFIVVWLALKIQAIAPNAPLKPVMISMGAVSAVYLAKFGCA